MYVALSKKNVSPFRYPSEVIFQTVFFVIDMHTFFKIRYCYTQIIPSYLRFLFRLLVIVKLLVKYEYTTFWDILSRISQKEFIFLNIRPPPSISPLLSFSIRTCKSNKCLFLAHENCTCTCIRVS